MITKTSKVVYNDEYKRLFPKTSDLNDTFTVTEIHKEPILKHNKNGYYTELFDESKTYNYLTIAVLNSGKHINIDHLKEI